jgi:hypothetical protein
VGPPQAPQPLQPTDRSVRLRTLIAAASAVSSLGVAVPSLAAVPGHRHPDAGGAVLSANLALPYGADAVAHRVDPGGSRGAGGGTTSTTVAPTTSTTVASTTSTTVASTTSTTVAATTSTTVPPTTVAPTTVPPTTSTTTPAPPPLLAPGDYFGGFDTPLSPTAPVASDSAALAADIVDQYQTYYGTFGVQTQYPIVTVGADQAPVPVASKAGCGDFQASTGPVPIPASAASLLPGDGDNPLIVWQPSTSSEWEFWQMSYSSGAWSACWGGKIAGVGSSGGVFPYPYGLAASGISYLATAVTEADVASGSIDHPLALQLPLCQGEVAPADRSDCGDNPGTPSEGMLFRLPASLPMPSGLTPFGQMVFRALQSYGAYVTDHSGAVVIVAEDPADWAASGHTGTDPITASWAGQPEYWAMNGIPWGNLEQVLPAGS